MDFHVHIYNPAANSGSKSKACFILENLQDYSSTQLERRRANHQQCWQNPEDLTQVEVERKASIKRYLVNKFMFSS